MLLYRLARLNSEISWASDKLDLSPWVQINFGEVMNTYGIIVQGYRGNAGHHRWVRNFKIQFGSTSESLDYMKGSDGETMVGIICVYLL